MSSLEALQPAESAAAPQSKCEYATAGGWSAKIGGSIERLCKSSDASRAFHMGRCASIISIGHTVGTAALLPLDFKKLQA
jgi:hypothetical protein